MTGATLRLASWEGRPIEHWRDAWGVPQLVALDVTGSTNDVARALADAGAPAGTTVLAETQTAGRGRGGRRWHATAGAALLLSIVLRPRLAGTPAAAPGAIPLRIGLAVAAAAERVAGIRPGVKWPNDVVVPGMGKVAGILCEGSVAGDHAHLVAGIGVNVNQSTPDFPPDVRPFATSLRLAAGREVSRAELAGAIIDAVRRAAGRDAAPLAPDELEALRERDALLGAPVSVDGAPLGVALGIAPDGALRVRRPDGRTEAVHTGTVRTIGRENAGRRERHP